MSNESLPRHAPGVLGAAEWLNNELSDLTTSMRLVCHGSDEEGRSPDRLVTQGLIHTALMDEIVYPALRDSGVNVAWAHEALHQALRDAAQAMKPGDEVAGQRMHALLQATAELVAHEAGVVADQLCAPGLDGVALGARLAKRQEELLTAGPAR